MTLWLWMLPEAAARVGGGEGFGGGGGSDYGDGGGGGSGGEIALLRLLIWLVFRHPAIGIPLLILAIIFWVMKQRDGEARRERPARARSAHRSPPRRSAPVRVNLAAIRDRDPMFSALLLQDLAGLIIARAWRSRAAGDLSPLRPYASTALLSRLEQAPRPDLQDLILGAVRVVGVELVEGRAVLSVDVEANLVPKDGPREYLRERWRLSRSLDQPSPGPASMQALTCPNCGDPASADQDGRCTSCGSAVFDGRVQWRADSVEELERRPVTAPELTLGGGVEVGTELPTIYAPDLRAAQADLQRRHPELSWDEFDRMVRHSFEALQRAWATQRWEDARPLLTDSLFNTWRYWIEQHKRHGLRNHVEDVKVQRVTIVKVEHDPFYDAITARIEARTRDWTVNEQGKILGGSQTQPRLFTEYWTFVRASSASASAGGDPERCPQCSAPLDRVNEGGVCGYCGAHVTGGALRWVLSGITQDEVYTG